MAFPDSFWRERLPRSVHSSVRLRQASVRIDSSVDQGPLPAWCWAIYRATTASSKTRAAAPVADRWVSYCLSRWWPARSGCCSGAEAGHDDATSAKT